LRVPQCNIQNQVRIEGQFLFEGIPSQTIWDFLTDPDRIAQCLPGCEKLIKTGEETYDMTLRISVCGIRGTFTGGIRLHDLTPTSQYQMTVFGSGAPGFVKGEGTVALSAIDTGTQLQYSGAVSAGGPIASVGQRMIGGAARMTIDQFFKTAAEKLKRA
jgi:carbon monoxide dehydrogenase subunit G